MTDSLRRGLGELAVQYTVEREVGRGGMGSVFRAHDIAHSRKVAIKILHAELAALVGTDRFAREIRITARLQHPNILALLHAGEAAGLPYYVMPYIEGESLAELTKREEQLSISQSVQIASEVATRAITGG